jgi:hypothetical protein
MDRLHDIIRPFDGDGAMDISVWLRKVKMVATLKNITELHKFLPLYLDGSAFAVFDQLSETDKESADIIEKTLLSAFAQDQFGAYDSFRQRSWVPGEVVDVFLADLRRLARLAGVENDSLVRCAFICGLPSDVSAQLRATARISSATLVEVAQQARILMGDRPHGAMAAVSNAQPRFDRRKMACYECGGSHLAKFCKQKKQPVTCWNCNEEGHISRSCPGNELGGSRAPVVPLRK